MAWSAQVLRRAEGALQLLDVSAQLPHLQRVPGLHAWRVKGAGAGFLSSWEDAESTGQVGPLGSLLFSWALMARTEAPESDALLTGSR